MTATRTRTRTWTSGAPRVGDVMSLTVITASPDTPLPQLVDDMLRYAISSVPITDAAGQLVGIVTEADLVSKAAYGGARRRLLDVIADIWRGTDRRWAAKSKGQTAGQVMTTEVETARPREYVRAAARRMMECNVKRLPVVDEGRLVGIISRADVLRTMHRNDEELLADVKAALADPLRTPEYTNVEVDVDGGVVTLRGTVRYPIDLPVLTGIVWRFPGVVDVRNEAVALEPDPQPWRPELPG